ncbi:hypothetical protein HA075_22685 [bacterium BFN5]|nr:hypothetical protein HA075_22685 [bacterium BFN5]
MTKIVKVILLQLLSVLWAAVVFAQGQANVQVVVEHTIPLGPNLHVGSVHWDHGTSGYIEVTGSGTPPANVHHFSQGRALARQAALMNAAQNLLETVQGVQLNANTTLRSVIAADNLTRNKVNQVIKHARIIHEIPQADGSYQVVMRIQLFGADSVADAIGKSIAVTPQEFPQIQQVGASVVEIYTGVVIDARGLLLEPTLFPLIYDESGRIVYGNMFIDQEQLLTKGVVGYSLSAEMFTSVLDGRSRSGNRPLMIKAIRLADNNCNVVISDADAALLLAGNAAVGYLKDCAVVLAK